MHQDASGEENGSKLRGGDSMDTERAAGASCRVSMRCKPIQAITATEAKNVISMHPMAISTIRFVQRDSGCANGLCINDLLHGKQ